MITVPKPMGLMIATILSIPMTHAQEVEGAESLQEIIVTAKQTQHRSLHPSQQLDASAIAMKAPVAATELFFGMPSLGTRTNSRGETVVRVRGSEERQTSVFLDGAPLTVPWDGRVDLAILPAGIIDHVAVITSAAPVEYGVNSILGVVDLTSKTSCLRPLCKLSLDLGEDGLQSYNAIGGWENSAWSMMGAVNYRRQDDQTAVSAAPIPFAPIEHQKRLNTDLKSATVWTSIGHRSDRSITRLSYLSVDASRGIAPAGHLDPSIKAPRYWRYPVWRLNTTTLNNHYDINDRWQLRNTAWHQSFVQRIDAYSDDSYQSVEKQASSNDSTTGVRLVAEYGGQRYGYRWVANWQKSVHLQRDHALDTGLISPRERYQQNVFSLASEWDLDATDALNLSLGVSYDRSATPFSGGRPTQKALSDWAANLAMVWSPSDTLSVAGTVGHRTRFPTLRELYGVALGKFLINPDLQPESALLGDITVDWRPDKMPFVLSVTPWFRRIDNTLSKRKVVVDGDRYDQRYNLQGSSGHGLEMQIIGEVTSKLSVEINGNKQWLTADRDVDGHRPAILQRPGTQYAVIADYRLSAIAQLRLMAVYTGAALDEDFDAKLHRLPSSTQLNAKLFYHFNNAWRASISIDNWNNDIVLPQLGLPGQGRTLRVGLAYSGL